MAADRFDVVVVGAGPAGCVLANRLTEEGGRSVCVLEAGPDYGPDPAGWPADLRDPTLVWYQSHPWGYQHAGRPPDRPLPLPRARVVGGSSTVNACYWLRGSAADYDSWAGLGNPGWSFAELLPYFRRAEADPLGGPLHGSGGPVPVFRAGEGDLTVVDRAFLAAARALGLPDQPDFNGAPGQRPGVGPMPKNLAGGVRMNAAFTYLAAARPRPNLALVAEVLVDRVVVEDGRAVGVRTSDGRVVGGREVVLCAGAYGSPAILLRSGIGPPAHLEALGIPVVAELPGVGEGLGDHPFLLPGTLRSWAIRPQHVPTARVLTQLAVKARSRQARDEIDLHLYEGQRFDEQRGRWVLYLAVSLMDARCRGRVRLTSPDPAATLDIDHRYFSEPADLEAMGEGVELALGLVATTPLAEVLEPGSGFTLPAGGREGLRAWIRDQAGTTFHPCSTCRMGPADDPGAVVDHAGRVHGLAGLRVADAAIFPTSPRANLHCTVVAAAEKLADAIRRGDPV
jgi:choline dehydrogenase